MVAQPPAGENYATGVQEDHLSNRRLMKRGEGINQVLLNCTRRLGENDEPKMEDILDRLTVHRRERTESRQAHHRWH